MLDFFADESTVAIAETLIKGVNYDLESDLQKMREIRKRVRLGPSTGSIVEEAVNRDIPWIRLGTNSLVKLGYGINHIRFQTIITCKTSNIAVERTEEEITNLIMEDISKSGRTVTHEIIPKEVEVIRHAINSAEEGSLITALSDVVINAIEIVQEYLDKENESGNN